jgi:hypothetical protein
MNKYTLLRLREEIVVKKHQIALNHLNSITQYRIRKELIDLLCNFNLFQSCMLKERNKPNMIRNNLLVLPKDIMTIILQYYNQTFTLFLSSPNKMQLAKEKCDRLCHDIAQEYYKVIGCRMLQRIMNLE